MMADVIAAPDQLSCARLTKLLRRRGVLRDAKVTDIRHAPIGHGLLGDSIRFEIAYDREEEGAPATLVGKFPLSDALTQEGARQAGIYLTEVRFYQEIATTVAVRAPRELYAEIDLATMDFGIIMEDMAPARGGDQLVGASPEDTVLAIEQAAALHGPRWNDRKLKRTDWLRSGRAIQEQIARDFPSFMKTFHERYDDLLEPKYMEICDRYGARAGDFLLREPKCWTTAHTDYRVDNMLFDAKGGTVPLAVVDWQTVACHSGALDVAYFLGLNIPIETRRVREREFLAYYLDRLRSYGVTDFGAEDLWREYRINAFYGVFTAIVGSCIAKRTPRGDQMFMTMARGGCAQMIDLETLTALA